MGMSVDRLLYMQEKGALPPGRAKLLDIGPQNVYHATAEGIREFVRRQGQRVSDAELDREVERLVYFSTPRPGERTTFLSEITDLTDLEYHSYDICPGLKTDIVDLNFDTVLPGHRGYFDVVLNFGTTEHVFNQWNSFEIIHDAARVGGSIYYQLPATGYLDHGYYCYTPLFFDDMAKANDYKVIELFFTNAGLCDLRELKIDVRKHEQYLTPSSDPLVNNDGRMVSFNVHALVRKTVDAGFRCGAEIATAHSPIDPRVRAMYEGPARRAEPAARDQDRDLLAEIRRLQHELIKRQSEIDAVRGSTSWKITAPLRAMVRSVRG